ncbi:hypothetical protein [Janthinobacterium sp.]|uniref:hypothetical protein n=1 Tax=Janthinobacterium sp. TaxID=1871054 RepID=UPI0028A1F545|nr:hypothetical protein [Janthinobacterium sp.]
MMISLQGQETMSHFCLPSEKDNWDQLIFRKKNTKNHDMKRPPSTDDARSLIANGVQCVAEGANIAGFAKWPTRC